jgi:hypothetical protein
VLYIVYARESDEEQKNVYERDKQEILGHTEKELNIEKAELTMFADQLTKADGCCIYYRWYNQFT